VVFNSCSKSQAVFSFWKPRAATGKSSNHPQQTVPGIPDRSVSLLPASLSVRQEAGDRTEMDDAGE
jgi:hypothetical protein